MELWRSFIEWTKRPYTQDMTLFHWFLFVGLIMLAMLAWSLMIRKVID